ncbi:ATP synthase F0F1 subunit epsilon [Desulfosporosinus sp. Tol-M]|nr:ATP synthase F0F1 subunit epsilon [Desulfosporosinus sp. Tol-M]
MAGAFSLQIVSPEGNVLKEEVEFVILPGEAGELGILPHHTALISGLKIGVIRYTLNSTVKRAAVAGGFVEVVDNSAIVLAETAELSEDIDIARAMEAKERAQKRLAALSSDTDVQRAELALRRAIARLSAAGEKK